jgi:hypothetical protein
MVNKQFPKINYMFRPLIEWTIIRLKQEITQSFSTNFGSHNGDDATLDKQFPFVKPTVCFSCICNKRMSLL